MDDRTLINTVIELEREIAALPSGSIAAKKVKGRTYHYHRITKNGKRKETYVRAEDLGPLESQIAKRKELEGRLRELKRLMPPEQQPEGAAPPTAFRMQILVSEALARFAAPVKGLRRRECFAELESFVYGPDRPKILALYGLRRTGKTTLIRQLIADMDGPAAERTAFIQARPEDTLADLNADLRILLEEGFRYIFVDEATLMPDFIEGAALLSDIYAASGMKIVLSGTDSLGLLLSVDDALYDRCVLVHTTFVPYREFERVLGASGIDTYIRLGGTMCHEPGGYRSDSPFATHAGADAYVDSAIARNIQHSLAHYQAGGHFRALRDLYDSNELTSAINRVIEDESHRFAVDVLTRAFESRDLARSAGNLRRDRSAPTDILDRIDRDAVSAGLKNALDILDAHEQTIAPNPDHAAQIREYLGLLDLVVDIDLVHLPGSGGRERIAAIAQPGMRYAQVKALISQLVQDEAFDELDPRERRRVEERIMGEVEGRMMEEIVLLETKLARPELDVFKLQFGVGEFDMVVWDREALACWIYEVKHSTQAVPQQARHLVDPDKCAKTEHRFGDIAGRFVIYRGESLEEDAQGVRYLNVEEYLKGLGEGR